MHVKKQLKKILGLVLSLTVLTGGLYYTPKAEDVTTLVMNYNTTVYTRQIYAPELEQIKSGMDSDSIKWVSDTCSHVAYITNGAVSLDTAAVVTFVKKEITAGNKNITLDLSSYTTQAVQAQALQAAQAMQAQAAQTVAAQQQNEQTGNVQTGVMSAEVVANLNKLGIDTKISECSTKYTVGQDRSLNIEVAAGRINGLILQPGQVFSYDAAILPRTRANGYGLGNVISGGTYVKAIGGGICQVSSTLNNAVLRAGIVPMERHNHSQSVHYLKNGLDATVSANTLDYKFVNTLSYPIYMSATTINGTLTISFYSNSRALNGLTYQTVVEGSNKKNTTYIVGYLNGMEVSRTKAYASSYK